MKTEGMFGLGRSLALPRLARPRVAMPMPGRATLRRSPDFPAKSETYRANDRRQIHRLSRSFALPNGGLRLSRSLALPNVALPNLGLPNVTPPNDAYLEETR